MPIAGYKSGTSVSQQPNLPAIAPENYKALVHDVKDTPLHTLMAYVEGSNWTLDEYFSQVVTEHNDLREIDPEEPNIYQQYITIHNLDIRVDSSLQPSYDQETGITSTVGGANIYASVIPNAADYFCAKSFGQEKALYKVNTVERKSFQQKSVYHIDYTLVGYVNSSALTLYQSLKQKSLRDMYFDRDRLIDGKQSTVRLEDHEKIKTLTSSFNSIVQKYFNLFFNRRYMTLVLPGQEHVIYDSHMVNYLLTILTTDDTPVLQHVRMPPTDHHLYLNQESFWDMMINRDINMLSLIHQKMSLVSRHYFLNLSYGKGAHYSAMDYFVYCKSPDTTYNVKDFPMPYEPSIVDLVQTENRHGTLASVLTERYVTSSINAQILYPFLFDDYYVMSENFYNDTNNKSLLEICVRDYLSKKAINIDYLLKIIEMYPSWARLEQFYYGPVILTLIKQKVSEQYT
jgi:hypothetical protein